METYARYRHALGRHVHAVCLDRHFHPASEAATEADCPDCPIDRWLPELITLASTVHTDHLAVYDEIVQRLICPRCGHRQDDGRCPIQEQADCCLARYLPLVLDAIYEVQEERAR